MTLSTIFEMCHCHPVPFASHALKMQSFGLFTVKNGPFASMQSNSVNSISRNHANLLIVYNHCTRHIRTVTAEWSLEVKLLTVIVSPKANQLNFLSMENFGKSKLSSLFCW